ncbi:hypothetical protein ACTHGU_16965 [Chitinophagaceae bacterium MMS25-I14]
MNIPTRLCYILLSCILFASCKHDVKNEVAPGNNDGAYPPDVAKIIISKCATSGCHNPLSYQLSGGLLMDTWDHMFNGGSNGAAVIPYDTVNSPLLYFINTDPSLGIASAPTMPYNGTPLSKDEYMTIRHWIASGAPDKNGNIPFATNPDTRQKYYLACSGIGQCKIVHVIDAERKVVMRTIRLGDPATSETAHNIRVSPDGMYAYVCSLSGQYIYKIDTRGDSIIAKLDMSNVTPTGYNLWSVINMSADGSKFMVSNWAGSGTVTVVNTAGNMSVANNFPNIFNWPHGIASSPNFDTFYVLSQYGNTLYKFTLDGSYLKKISIDGKALTTTAGSAPATPDPHDIFMVPDHSKYFITCQSTNEVRVLDAHADTVIKVFSVGTMPQELTLSTSKPYMFVSCQEDPSALAKSRGSVYVFDYNQLTFVQKIDGGFFQPHGICVDDKNGVFCIVSRNYDPTGGPAPHHSSTCGKNNGWYQVYDLNTLQPANNRRYEVTPDPYFIDARFK